MERKTRRLIVYLFAITTIILLTSTIPVSAQIEDPIQITKIEWSPDATRIAYGMSDGTISIWDITQDTEVMHLTGHSDRITTLSWKQDGEQLASGSLDGTARLWDLQDGSIVYVFDQYNDFITQVIWVNNDNKVVVFYFANFPFGSIHDVVTGEEVGRVNMGTLLDSQYNPVDDIYAISGYGGNVWITNATDLSIIERFLTPVPMTNNAKVIWNDDYSLLAIGDWDGHVFVRDMVQDVWIQTFRFSEDENSSVTALSFDNDRLIGVAEDGTLRIWDIDTGRILIDEKLGETVSSAAFSPDGTQLAYVEASQQNAENAIDMQALDEATNFLHINILQLKQHLETVD